MHGSIAANRAVDRADLIIALGARFSDRVALNPEKFGKKAHKIQVDIDTSEINKNVLVDVGISADIKEFLTALLPLIKKNDHADWVSQSTEWKKKTGDVKSQDAELHPSEIIQSICDMTDKETIYVTDVGQHQMWAAQFYKYDKPRKFLTSGGLGTMGYGLGASLGAKVGNSDKIVVNIAGDGCFRMNLNELATASRYNIPVIEVIINNSVLGMVRQWQDLFYEERYSYTTLQDKVDFVKVAEGLGVQAKKITDIEQFKDAFKEALNAGEPVVLDCHIDLDDKVWPMVNPGGSIEDAFDKADLEAQAR